MRFFALCDSGLIEMMHSWLEKEDKPRTQILRFMVSLEVGQLFSLNTS